MRRFVQILLLLVGQHLSAQQNQESLLKSLTELINSKTYDNYLVIESVNNSSDFEFFLLDSTLKKCSGHSEWRKCDSQFYQIFSPVKHDTITMHGNLYYRDFYRIYEDYSYVFFDTSSVEIDKYQIILNPDRKRKKKVLGIELDRIIETKNGFYISIVFATPKIACLGEEYLFFVHKNGRGEYVTGYDIFDYGCTN